MHKCCGVSPVYTPEHLLGQNTSGHISEGHLLILLIVPGVTGGISGLYERQILLVFPNLQQTVLWSR